MNINPSVLPTIRRMKKWHTSTQCGALLMLILFVQAAVMIPHGVNASTTTTTKSTNTILGHHHHHQLQPKVYHQGSDSVSITKEEIGNKMSHRLQPTADLMSRLLQTSGGNRRGQEVGDFDELNKIFAETEIILPEVSFNAGKFLFKDLLFTASQTTCSGLSIGNIIVRHANVGTSNTEIIFTLELVDLAFNCDVDWSYDWLFDGSGDGQIYSSGNYASIGVTFTSADFSLKPPTSAQLSSCAANIQIDDIDLQGGLDAYIINAIEQPLRNPIENALKGVICEEADAISNALINLITTLDDFIEPYQIDIPLELSDPLYPEQNSLDMDLISESGVELLAYNDSSLFQMLLTFIDDNLGGPVEDPDSPTGTGMDLGVNKIIRSAILNDDRMLVVDGDSLPNNGLLLDSEDLLSKSTITIERIALKGLDTMTTFDPLKIHPGGEYTLSNSFGFNYVDVEVDLTVEIRSASSGGSIFDSDEVVTERISIDFGVDDLNVDFSFLLALDSSKIGSIPFGAILTDFDNLTSCLLGMIVHSAEVSFLSATAGNLESPKLDGFISKGIDRVITSGADAVFAMYEGALLDLIPNIFQVGFRKSINDMLRKALEESKDCSFGINLNGTASKYLNFADLFLDKEDAISVGGLGKEQYGGIMKSLYNIIEAETIDASGPSFINESIIRPLTSRQSGNDGSIVFNEPLVDMGSNIELGELKASFDFKLSDLSIENLDTMGSPLSLIRPSSPQVLDNTFALGVGENPLTVKTRLMFAFNNGVDIVENELDIELEMYAISVDVDAFMEILEELFLNFPLRDITIVDCWLSKIPAPLLDEFGIATSDSSRSMFFENLKMSASKIRLNVECIKCTSPEFEDLANDLSSVEGTNEFTGAINDTFDWVVNILGGNFAQIQIDRLLANSQMKCPHSSSYASAYQTPKYNAIEYDTLPPSEDNFLIQFVAIIGGLLLSVIAVIAVVRWIKKKRYESWALTLTPEERFGFAEKARRENSRQSIMDRRTTSIFRSSSVPVFVRFVVPLVIIGNILLFLSGHLSLGAGVNVNIELAGQSVPLGIVFEFSLGSSILDMWESGAKELAVIVAVFSGVWPYIKQLVTFFLWFCPTRFVSVSRRGLTLQWLDTLGKWSFIDIFVLVITLAAFRITVNSPDDFAFLPLNFYSVDLLVIPSWGLYANMIAQVLSQISSHFIIHFHRKIVNGELHEENQYLANLPSKEKLALRENVFGRDGAKVGKGLVVKQGISTSIIVLSIAASVLFCCGCAFDTFQFENFGLLGVLIESGQDLEEASTSYGVFTMMRVMFEQAGYTGVASDYIGLGFLAFLFVSTVLLVPLAQIILLLLRWFRPMDRKERNRFYVAIETLSAWQYSEVFILSVVITSWQLAPVSEFFINDECEGLKSTFDALVLYGVLENTDAQCFRAEPSIKFATWLLTAGAIGLAILNHFISAAAMHQDEDEVALYRDQLIIPPNGAMTAELDGQVADKVDDALEDDLKIPSARFTDYYRWLLQSMPKDTLTPSVRNGDQVQIQFEMNPRTDIEEPDIIIPVASPQSQKEFEVKSKNPDQLKSFNEEPAIIIPVPYPQPKVEG